MNQNYIALSVPPKPGQRAVPPESMPPGYPPVWYGWPPPWCGTAPAYAPAPMPPAPPTALGGVRKLVYNVEEAAEALGVSRSEVYRLIHQEDFPSAKLRGRRVISIELLEEWVRRQAGNSMAVLTKKCAPKG